MDGRLHAHDTQVKFKAKEVPKHVKQQRLLSILEETEQRKAAARAQAQKKLESINNEFEQSLSRVAGAMSAAMQPFVGTIEDNIMCMYRPKTLACTVCSALGAHGHCECAQLSLLPTPLHKILVHGCRCTC